LRITRVGGGQLLSDVKARLVVGASGNLVTYSFRQISQLVVADAEVALILGILRNGGGQPFGDVEIGLVDGKLPKRDMSCT
jgi:hypothetical protein